ncbi:MAG: hypothetical protein RQ731_08045 [Anaerosomatales bacterium]|nr:hypothetical protein [Anaerosomatales bacterium]
MTTRWGEPTDTLVLEALRTHAAGHRLTQAQRILLILNDGAWHDGRELALKVTHRFSSPLKDLADTGVSYDKRHNPDVPRAFQYRLAPTAAPEPTLF